MSRRIEEDNNPPGLWSLVNLLYLEPIPYNPFEPNKDEVVKKGRKRIPNFKVRHSMLVNNCLSRLQSIGAKSAYQGMLIHGTQTFYNRFNMNSYGRW
jgi:hypothetical protein